MAYHRGVGRPSTSRELKKLAGTYEPRHEARHDSAVVVVRNDPSIPEPAPPLPVTRDYVGIATAYAQYSVGDKKGAKFGKWVRLAAKRFLGDLKAAGKPGHVFSFDEAAAGQACAFIELLPHVEGSWDTVNIVMHPAHVFMTVNIFGFRKPDGSRRFSTALFACGRKNAKSSWAAGVLLYCLLCEGEVGPQAITAATTGSQARIVFNVAKRMVERSSVLRETYGAVAFANAVACFGNHGSLKPINAKASTQDGLNPSAVCLDELHAHKTHDLLNVLKSAAGARRNPLFLYTTTEGYESPGPWAEQRSFAHQVLGGVLQADHFFAVIYALDTADDDFDESKWVKANPLMEVNPLLLAEIRKEAIEAKSMPGRLAEFRIKRLNRQSSVAEGWIEYQQWKACDGPVLLADMVGKPCWAALDLASTRDMCAWFMVWKVAGIYYTWGRYWVPSQAIKQRAVRGTVPYQAWVTSGHLQETDGAVTDYAVVEADILEDCKRFTPKVIHYDPWNASDLVNRLTAAGLPLVKFIQGPKSFHPAMQEFERAYTEGNLRHGGNPILTWNAANLVVRRDINLNMAPDRKNSNEKIDGIVALIMAMGGVTKVDEVATMPSDYSLVAA